jgi:hypothetical protein
LTIPTTKNAQKICQISLAKLAATNPRLANELPTKISKGRGKFSPKRPIKGAKKKATIHKI